MGYQYNLVTCLHQIQKDILHLVVIQKCIQLLRTAMVKLQSFEGLLLQLSLQLIPNQYHQIHINRHALDHTKIGLEQRLLCPVLLQEVVRKLIRQRRWSATSNTSCRQSVV